MSKLVDTYISLKKENPSTIFLFKQGIFLISIADDAKLLSEKFGFKLINLNDTTVKCGFPNANREKYFNKFKEQNLNVKVYDSNIIYKAPEYLASKNNEKIICKIKDVDINSLSVYEAYKFIEDLKKEVTNM